MTLEQRIEAAARAYRDHCYAAFDNAAVTAWTHICEADRNGWRDKVRTVGRLLFPELTSSPPTHWVAPMTPTPEDCVEAVNATAGWLSPAPWRQTQQRYEHIRDAYLKALGEVKP